MGKDAVLLEELTEQETSQISGGVSPDKLLPWLIRTLVYQFTRLLGGR